MCLSTAPHLAFKGTSLSATFTIAGLFLRFVEFEPEHEFSSISSGAPDLNCRTWFKAGFPSGQKETGRPGAGLVGPGKPGIAPPPEGLTRAQGWVGGAGGWFEETEQW